MEPDVEAEGGAVSELNINNRKIRLMKGDITDQQFEAFVYYATENLKLGAGFGNAISMRGGATVQKELDQLAPVEVGGAVATEAGKMKARHIIHAVGPKFQQEDEERLLQKTIESCMKLAEEKGIKQLAFPAMGCGFYGIPLATSARVMFETVSAHLKGDTCLEDVIFCLLDNREYIPFEKHLSTLN